MSNWELGLGRVYLLIWMIGGASILLGLHINGQYPDWLFQILVIGALGRYMMETTR